MAAQAKSAAISPWMMAIHAYWMWLAVAFLGLQVECGSVLGSAPIHGLNSQLPGMNVRGLLAKLQWAEQSCL